MLSPKKVKVKKKSVENKIKNFQSLIDDGKEIFRKSDVIPLPPTPINDSTDYNNISFKNSVIDKLQGKNINKK